MNVQAKVALDKEAHPERYCPTRRCLWRTGGGYCPRHGQPLEMGGAADRAVRFLHPDSPEHGDVSVLLEGIPLAPILDALDERTEKHGT